MSKQKPALVSHFEPPHASVRSYVIGFVSCIVLSFAMYLAALSYNFSKNQALIVIAVLAVLQCVIQLRRFLHLGNEFKPRWKLAVFWLMLSLVLIIVIGSIWIMNNLNYRMMHSANQTTEYVQSQDGL